MSRWRVTVPELKRGIVSGRETYYFVRTCVEFGTRDAAVALYEDALQSFHVEVKPALIALHEVSDD